MELFVNYKWPIILLIAIPLVYFVFDYLKNLLSVKKDIHFKDKDSSITEKLIDKFPLVQPEFFNKTLKEQNIENNQEIHELNKKIDSQNENIEKLLKIVEELTKNGKIH